ncbi:MAG: diguanylate cyclase [Erysipelotrichaceae bacterium]|nr:diguanylate cyclase [Erysipelotrichaceae bacterium]
MFINRKKNDGISLRTIHLWLVLGAAVVSIVMFNLTFNLSNSFERLTETSENQIEMRKAARELMDASDYLTEKVQRFTVMGESRFMDEYFVEAFVANRREEAIQKMSEGSTDEEALEDLKEAMNGSVELMKREYYAMRLVIEAQNIEKYASVLDSVELSEQDKALSSEKKMELARRMVHDDDYYAQKDYIRDMMRASLDVLEKMAYDTDAAAMEDLRKEMVAARLIIILQILVMIFMVWLTSKLGIHPVLTAVDRIKADAMIPETGANEFRYLARAYNKMYEAYKKSLENLNFKASHDELTGAYNRAGYDLLLSSIDLNKTYMMLFDVDNFKHINDTYGHEAGDKVLVKLVDVMKKNFRSDDYICRIGGDEFVVLMVHSSKIDRNLISQKIDDINRELAEIDDGLPAASISVGIVHGSDATDIENLFEKTDEAMYHSKKQGKNTYTFYSDLKNINS